jgi:hypothetical protein
VCKGRCAGGGGGGGGEKPEKLEVNNTLRVKWKGT